MDPSGWPATDASEVERLLDESRARDATFASGRILGSMCTAPHPLGRATFARFMETNLGDPALNVGTRDLELKATALLLRMLDAPMGAGGVFVSGGSEANFTALRLAAKLTGKREVVLPRSAHFSFDKACDYLGLQPVWARLTPDYRVDVDHVRELVNERTACIVGIAGTTEFGTVDDIPALADIGRDLGARVHVDAAWGGFLLPFLRDTEPGLPATDFTVEGVTSVTVDPHKFGLAPIPSGFLAARQGDDFIRTSTPTPYVSVARQPTLQGTRSGAACAATWAVLTHLGHAGYRANAERAMSVARHAAKRFRAIGVAPLIPPVLPLLTLPVADPVAVRAALAEEGWLVNLAPLTKGIKIVCMPHVTRESIDAFVPVLEGVLSKLGGSPTHV